MQIPTVLLFTITWAAILGVVLYALGFGGSTERMAALAYGISVPASWASYRHDGSAFASLEPCLALVDLCVFGVFAFLVAYARRKWPIVPAGLQLAACLSHFMKILDPGLNSGVYAQLESAESWPILMAIAGATYLRRRRITSAAAEASWKASLPLLARQILKRLRLD